MMEFQDIPSLKTTTQKFLNNSQENGSDFRKRCEFTAAVLKKMPGEPVFVLQECTDAHIKEFRSQRFSIVSNNVSTPNSSRCVVSKRKILEHPVASVRPLNTGNFRALVCWEENKIVVVNVHMKVSNKFDEHASRKLDIHTFLADETTWNTFPQDLPILVAGDFNTYDLDTFTDKPSYIDVIKGGASNGTGAVSLGTDFAFLIRPVNCWSKKGLIVKTGVVKPQIDFLTGPGASGTVHQAPKNMFHVRSTRRMRSVVFREGNVRDSILTGHDVVPTDEVTLLDTYVTLKDNQRIPADRIISLGHGGKLTYLESGAQITNDLKDEVYVLVQHENDKGYVNQTYLYKHADPPY